MADDFDDDKDNKGKKKDSADFAQIMNVVNDIKGRVKDLNPVTFTTLRSTLANVLDAHPEVAEFANIKEIFEQLELALKEEEQRVQAVIAALINDENKAAEAKMLEEAAEKAREEIERRAEVAGIYKAFDSLADEHVKGQEEDDKNLDEVIKATEEGREIDEETKKKLIKTPEQIEAEKQRWQHIDQTNKIADKEKKHHSNAIQNVKKLEEKVAHLPENHPERVSLANTRKYHEHHHGLAETKKVQCEKYYDKRKSHAEKLCLAAKETKKERCNEDIHQILRQNFHKIHGITPEELVKEPGIGGSSPPPTPAVMSLQQSSDKQQVIPNSDEKERTNEVTKQVEQIKEKLGYGQKQSTVSGRTVAGEKNGTVTPNETPNAKVIDPKKVRVGRW